MNAKDQDLYQKMYLAAMDLLAKGAGREDLESELIKLSEDVILVTVVITEARKDHFETLRKDGFRLILTGCILAGIGFLITFFNFNTNRSVNFAMYGLTSLGILFIFLGLYKILG